MAYKYKITLNDGEEITHADYNELTYQDGNYMGKSPWIKIGALDERGHCVYTNRWINLDFATSIEKLPKGE